MKITLTDVNHTINDIKSATGNEKVMPILSHILIKTGEDEVIFSAFDLENELKIRVPAIIDTQGSACIPASKLSAFSKISEDIPISISCNDSKAVLKSKSRCTVNILPEHDFPDMPAVETDCSVVQMDAAMLSSAISKIEHCAPRSDFRFYLNGINLCIDNNKINLAATNGHKLGRIVLDTQTENTKTGDVIIPIRSALLIAKLFKTGNLTLQINSSQICISNDSHTLTCKTIDGRYPDISKFFNENYSYKTLIDSQEFISCLEAASITIEEHKSINLTIDDTKLIAENNNKKGEESQAQAKCKHDGSAYTLAFNVDYLISAAKQIKGHLQIISDGESKIYMSGQNDSLTYLIMSMRI